MWLFSEADAALAAQEHYAQTVPLLIRKVIQDEIMGAFAELHTMGIERILLNNGVDSVEIRRDDILPPPDWTPAANVPVTNPKLMLAMLRFFQTLYAKDSGEDRPQRLSALEEAMLREGRLRQIPRAYAHRPGRPCHAEQGVTGCSSRNSRAQTVRRFSPLSPTGSSSARAFDQNEWGGYIASYDDLLTLSRNFSGIVINCNGTPVKIGDANRERIETFRGEK